MVVVSCVNNTGFEWAVIRDPKYEATEIPNATNVYLSK